LLGEFFRKFRYFGEDGEEKIIFWYGVFKNIWGFLFCFLKIYELQILKNINNN
jgi:hypothetical protein